MRRLKEHRQFRQQYPTKEKVFCSRCAHIWCCRNTTPTRLLPLGENNGGIRQYGCKELIVDEKIPSELKIGLGYLDIGETQPILYKDDEKVVYLMNYGKSKVICVKNLKSDAEVRIDIGTWDSKNLQVYTPPGYEIVAFGIPPNVIFWQVVPLK